MKKIVALSLLAVTLAGTSAFGQGYFVISSGKSQVWDGFSTGVAHTSTSVDVAFLWGASTATPLVASLLTQTPTSGINGTTESYTVAQAWTAILNDPNFTLAVYGAGANIGNTVIATSAGNGVITANGGTSFGVQGTTAGVTYNVYEISWNAAYATPGAAQTAGSAVGWSSVITDTPGTSTQTGLATLAPAQFGTFIPAVVPEPGTLALAALGGAAMLFIRRKK
jgi:hypothetical protein